MFTWPSKRARRRSGCTTCSSLTPGGHRGRGDTGSKIDRIDADRLSELLRLGSLKAVCHRGGGLLTLKELVRSYVNLVEDSTRVMLRIKALFRARGIKTPGRSVYRQSTRKSWLSQLEQRGTRMRAEALFAELGPDFATAALAAGIE